MMSIATDIEVNWRGTIDQTNKIGLSATLNQLGLSVFDNAEYCLGFENPALKLTKESEGYPKSTESSNNVAFYIANNIGYSLNGFNNPDGAYYRTLLLAVPTNWTWGWDSNLRSNNNTVRIVTKLDLSKNKGYLTTLETTKSDRVTPNNLVYGVNESLPDTGALGILLVGNVEYKILCANVYLTDNGYYVKFPEYIDPLYDNFNAQYGEGALPNFNYDNSSNKMFSAAPVMFSNAGWTISTSASGPGIYNVSTYNNTEVEVPPAADNTDYKIFGTYSKVGSFYWRVQYQMSVEYWLWLIASYGLLFEWNGTAYKPIIENGALKGYTNDMTVPSDIDNWTDISGHNISPTPPPPPSPSGDDLDDIDLSDALYGAGMAHYYICTKASGVLDTISEAMGNLRFSEAGTNLFPNLISCKLFPSGTGAVPAVNSTFKIAGKELLDPDDEQPISIQEVTGSPSIIIEDIAIDRKFGDFRDYAPYTMIELYVPFCGWTALPSWSMGGTVSGKIIIDIIDGSCKAVIEVTKNGKKTPVAELSGCCSLDIPFTAENVGAKMAGIMSAMSASATAALESAVGVGTMTVTGGKSGGKSVISGLTSYAASLCQATLVNNQNYTQVTGRTGDGCNLGGITDVVLKIQRPNTTEYSAPLYVPDGFAHAIGFMSMKQKKVSECTGLIICDNVDTSGIGGATDDERAEIKRVLETGLYVNAAPE